MEDLNALPLDDLFALLNPPDALAARLRLAMAEDLGEAGDVTSESIIEPDRAGGGAITARHEGVVCGLAIVEPLLQAAGMNITFTPKAHDGKRCGPEATLGRLEGPLRDLLTIERTLLNYLGHLSGIATMTRRFVDAVAETGAVICDTRKTTPTLRGLEKYAVRCGGASLHRAGLYDAALYKDNHLAHLTPDEWAEAIDRAARRARENRDLRMVEVEVDTIEQLQKVFLIEPGLIDIVLLDNMGPETMREAVALRDERGSGVLLEASGGITFEMVRLVAETGVDRIAIGAITHSAEWLDVALDIDR